MAKSKCLNCRWLGECKKATFDMVYAGKGCHDWSGAQGHVIEARVLAYSLIGNLAIRTLLIRNEPNKSIRRTKNVHP